MVIKEPSAWWQWPLYLVYVALFIAFLAMACVVSGPYLAMYPEHAPHRYDRGTMREREIIERYRRRLSRTPIVVRIARGGVAVIKLPFDYVRYLVFEVFNPRQT